MRHNPVLSEAEAFGVTVAVLVLSLLSILVGWIATPVAGVIVFAVVGLAGMAIYMSAPEHSPRMPLRVAVDAPHPNGAPPGTLHVIIVANESLAGEELDAHIRGLGDGTGTVEVDVLAPVLTSRTHLSYTDIDAELREARERLSRSLAWARGHGFVARGSIGDTSPIVAIEDELRDFGADEVIVTTSKSGAKHWQEQVELDHLRNELDLRVVQMAMH